MQSFLRVVSVAVALAWCAPAAAQSSQSDWQVTMSPYLMGASMSGTAGLRGREAELEMSASDIFANLQFGFMGMLEARKGHWGFGGDIIWMALGTTVREINADFNQGAFAFYGLRALGPAADLNVGLRLNTLEGTLDFKRLGVDVAQDKAWIDPFVGITLRSSTGRRIGLRVYGEVGGFGMGSDFAWQLFPSVGIGLTERASLDLGYRWLDVDYDSGEGNERFVWNMLSQGPVVGFSFRF